MLDPLLSLSFAVQSNKGVYAVLLGSGVSRSAGIPTGWEVVLDLIRKLAHLKGQSCEPSPESWYKELTGREPDYAKLLAELTNTAAERQQLLRSYFEPTEEERALGQKTPTAAHKAIASLVASGHFRVIVTTNFDHLMENALREKGIAPSIISTADAAKGAVPLTHAPCTIIKPHGDYLDSRIKNTPKELSKYEQAFRSLLSQVIENYGLIVSGWSAEWDTALRSVFERCKSRRYGVYWVSRGEPQQAARRLIEFRGATIVPTKGADEFFTEVEENITALSDFARPHPLSTSAAVGTLKRYIADESCRVRLSELISQETERFAEALLQSNLFSSSDFALAIKGFNAMSERMDAIIAAGCYWATTNQAPLWKHCLERLANVGASQKSGNAIGLSRYPAMRLLYIAGIVSLKASQLELLRLLFHDVFVRSAQGVVPAVRGLVPRSIFPSISFSNLHLEGLHRCISFDLCSSVRSAIREYVPDEFEYEALFDRFEYYRSLSLLAQETDKTVAKGYPGKYIYSERLAIIQQVTKEFSDSGRDWPPLVLFGGGGRAKFGEILRCHDDWLARLRNSTIP